jgi:hypothetical protein
MGLLQGLGEMPAGLVAGTACGRLCLVTRTKKQVPLPSLLEGQPNHFVALNCLAATDHTVVTGANDGALRVVHMTTP